jgi:GntR family histidine utilization transcriptional repressor
MAQYGCSRMTVNKAMSALVEAGLIVRRRAPARSWPGRACTPRCSTSPTSRPRSSRGARPTLRLLVAGGAQGQSGDSPDEIELAAGGELLELRGLHDAGDRPFALEDRLISLAAPIAAAWTSPRPARRLAAATRALDRGREPDQRGQRRRRADGRLLALDVGAACLVVERRTWREGQPVTWVRQLFPGEAYDLVARFGPSA